MDSTSFFGELLKQYGVHISLFVFLFIYVFKDLWGKCSPLFFSSKDISIKKHLIFRDFDDIIGYTLKEEFNCECPIRKELYRDILTENIKCFRNRLYEFVQTDLESKELYPTRYDFFLKVNSVLNEARSEIRANLLARGIPVFITDRFDEHREPYQYILEAMIKTTCQSEYIYKNNTDRMRTILSTIDVFCKSQIDLVEETLALFNGDIKTLKYNGVHCENCKICIHDEYIRHTKGRQKNKPV